MSTSFNSQKITDELSEFLFESSLSFNDDITIRGALKYDPNEGHLSKSNFSMRYQPSLDSVINLNFRQKKSSPIVSNLTLNKLISLPDCR